MTPLDFLTLLWEDKPDDQLILIWTLQHKQSHWFCSLPQAADFLQTHQTDVYVGVGLSKQDYGPDHRCPSSEVAGIPGLWADLDVKSAAHPKDLPASIEVALTLIPASLPPTIIIATGNGIQAWWLFEEPWIFENENQRKEAATLSSRFQTLLRYNASQHGWKFERLSDLARVLRIPGTVNGKDPNEPKQVTVHSFGGRRYNPSEFEEYLDDLAIPDPEAEQIAAKDWKERFADKPITINVDARIPQEVIDRWCQADPRFKNTWFRQRNDLNDSSQSGYDMALACFGVAQGLASTTSAGGTTRSRGSTGSSVRPGPGKPPTSLARFAAQSTSTAQTRCWSRASPGAPQPSWPPRICRSAQTGSAHCTRTPFTPSARQRSLKQTWLIGTTRILIFGLRR
jgi:hypothetical protein